MAAEDTSLAISERPMNPVIRQFITLYRNIPPSKKILMAVVVVLLVAGFSLMFYWANKIEYQTLYTGLTPEDAAAIVEKLKENKIPYELAGNGSVVRVPAQQVYDVRLTLAAAGLPKGGSVGYELFDETDFGTTEFVQKMNYQRALQGELARTIREFREIEDARVMIVMPKDSIFIEDAKPPSASVLLKLKNDLTQEKVSAVVHLVASAIEGMTPDRVTVVDTRGKVLYKGASEEERIGDVADSQFKYKLAFEQNLAQRIQTMLERIVGDGKAIVRVTADMNFDQTDLNEEIYDPDVSLVRSRQQLVEVTDKTGPPGRVSSVNPVVPQGQSAGVGGPTEKTNKQDETVNYELNRTLRRTVKSVGTVRRLSVAAVLDGTYETQTDEAGNAVRKFVPRTESELAQFRGIVQNAMGYSEDREDQVTVESFPFSYVTDMEAPKKFDWKDFSRQYGKGIINLLLVALLFLFIILPLLKSMKEIKATVIEALPSPEEERKALAAETAAEELLDPKQMPLKQRASHYSHEDFDKTSHILRGWLAES